MDRDYFSHETIEFLSDIDNVETLPGSVFNQSINGFDQFFGIFIWKWRFCRPPRKVLLDINYEQCRLGIGIFLNFGTLGRSGQDKNLSFAHIEVSMPSLRCLRGPEGKAAGVFAALFALFVYVYPSLSESVDLLTSNLARVSSFPLIA